MKRWKNRYPAFALVALLALSTLATAPVSAAEAGSPRAVVETLHGSLLDVMKQAGPLGYDGRFEKVGPALDAAFDLDFMARKTLGRHWKKLAEPEQERWRGAFRRLTVANYAGRFDGYSGQHFETVGEEPAARETMVVRTRLVLPEDEDVELNYRLRETPQGWRIVDVYLNGTVSELALRRSEYASVLKREGFAKLIERIEQKAEDLAK